MSLQQVEHASGGQWTVVAVGSWERADRALTVAKLAGLAEFYGVATEELLPAHSAGPAAAGGRRLTIDLQRLVALPARQAGPLARYAAAIQQQRHDDHNRTVLTIREHDLHSLAVLYDLAPDNLAQTLINWGVLTADPPPPRQPTAPAGSPGHPTATEVALERNRTQDQRGAS
jgi:transcriptional regulator with XRE-family HTH domain